MNSYLKMIVFVVLLGLLTSGVFVGMEIWTGPLIEANAANEIKSTILDANGYSYTTATINDIFDQNITAETVDGLTLYFDNSSGRVSYEFSGGGVWGPIIGIITLESDYVTIKEVKVLQQEETPGLGGVVASANYLAQFPGIKFSPKIEINIPDGQPNKANEVDSISGATRTSRAFETILNNAYEVASELIDRGGN